MNSRGITKFAAAFGFSIVILIVFAPALGYGYVWDDLIYLTDRVYYQGSEGFINAATKPFFISRAYYRPLVVITFVPAVGLGAITPLIHHGVNILIHLVNAILVFKVAFLLVSKTRGAYGAEIACIAALFYAANPLVVESVVWISGRYDLMMCTFVLGFILLAFKLQPSRWKIFALTALYSAAMFSKEAAVGLILAMPMLHLIVSRSSGDGEGWRGFRNNLGSLKEVYLSILLGTLIYFGVRYAVLGEFLPSNSAGQYGPKEWAPRLNLIASAIAEFYKLLFNPWKYSSPLRPFSETLSYAALSPQFWLVAMVLVLLVFFSIKWQWPLVFLVYIAMAWPALHLISYPNGGNIIADRYALAPYAVFLVGLSVVSGVFLTRHALSKFMQLALVGCVGLMLLGSVAFVRVNASFWRNDPIFWNVLSERYPNSTMAAVNHMRILMTNGEWDSANEVIVRLMATNAPVSLTAITNFMIVRAKLGDYDDAMAWYGVAERMRPSELDDKEMSTLWCARGDVEVQRGNFALALEFFEKSVERPNEFSQCRLLYAEALFMEGQQEKSIQQLDQFLAEKKSIASLRNEYLTAWRQKHANRKETR
ncbi:tetratricopeptide repeat protein [Ottowia oryzae]